MSRTTYVLVPMAILAMFVHFAIGQAAEPKPLPRLRVSDNHRFLVTEDFHEDPWLDFTSIQSSHGDRILNWKMIEKDYARQPVTPVIDLETTYPDALIMQGMKPGNDDHARRSAYWSVFAGACGHTYGHNSIWQMWTPGRTPILNPKCYWYDAIQASSAAQMGVLRKLIESRPFLSRVPDQSLLASDPGEGIDHLRATRGDGYAMIYSPNGRSFKVHLDRLSGKTIRASWFDPRTGSSRRLDEFTKQEDRDFDPPGEPAVGNDWVLLLDDANTSPAPGGVGDKRDSARQSETGEHPIESLAVAEPIRCEGVYRMHLQGICTDDKSLFWSFTDVLVKTDRSGQILKKVSVANHHGDLCYLDGRIYVAVNLGKFNDPQGNADSWVYVYDVESLSEVARHKVAEVIYGAGGIGCHAGRFIVVGGLPPGIEENYAYEYDMDFKFVRKHTIQSGYTLMGIQTATFSGGYWWFGCYGKPELLLKTDKAFKLIGKYEFNGSLGIVGQADGSFLVARGTSEPGRGHTATISIADADAEKGLAIREGPRQ
ncbi:MAG: apiosidase-like domain-containing protein [Pirellulaceae bacterium]